MNSRRHNSSIVITMGECRSRVNSQTTTERTTIIGGVILVKKKSEFLVCLSGFTKMMSSVKIYVIRYCSHCHVTITKITLET